MTHSARTRRPLSRLVAGAAAALLALAGCTGLGSGADGEPDPGTGASTAPGAGSEFAYDGPALEETETSAAELSVDPAEDPAYAEYYAQEITWGACEDLQADGAECGTLTVPLAWNAPGEGDIEIAVGRLQATGESTGSLVVNPGGPGGSGVNFLESATGIFSEQVRAAYDVVGFDPRGVQRSEGVRCLDAEETDEYLGLDVTPGTPEAEKLEEEWSRRIIEGCQENSGDVLPYLDTLSSARDMDVLRAALGAEQLDYLGYSYGTYLGATFAELHPERVGSFVLDGALDPTLSSNQISAGQVEGFEKATDVFLADCLAAGDSCPFTGTEEEAKQQLHAFFSTLDSSPLTSDQPDRPVSGMMARSVLMSMLYEDALWQLARDAFSAAMTGDGSQLLWLNDLLQERLPDGTYRTNMSDAIKAINCLDRVEVADDATVEEEGDRLAEEFPTFGPWLYGGSCETWPVRPVRDPAPLTAEGAGPIVVIGTTGDPATPYAWSQSLADQLDDSVLLTFEGQGHTAYGRSGGCIEKAVDAYLLEDTVPEDGLTC